MNENHGLRVHYRHGGEHTLVRWAKDYDGWHLLLGSTPARTDTLACKLISEYGDEFRYKTPQRIEVVAPPEALEIEQRARATIANIRKFEMHIQSRARQLYKITNELPPGCEWCSCTQSGTRDDDGEWPGCDECYTGIRVCGARDPEAMVSLYRRRIDIVRPQFDKSFGEYTEGHTSLARRAQLDEVLWCAFDVQGNHREGTVVKLVSELILPMETALFFYVVKGDVELPKLDELRRTYLAGQETAKRLEAERLATRNAGQAERDRARAEELRAELKLWLGV